MSVKWNSDTMEMIIYFNYFNMQKFNWPVPKWCADRELLTRVGFRYSRRTIDSVTSLLPGIPQIDGSA